MEEREHTPNAISHDFDAYADYLHAKWCDHNQVLEKLTEAENQFTNAWGFWQVMENAGEIACNFELADFSVESLKAIGATKALQSIEALRPYFDEAASAGQLEQWRNCKERDHADIITSLEEPAFEEDWEGLLLAYARKNITIKTVS